MQKLFKNKGLLWGLVLLIALPLIMGACTITRADPVNGNDQYTEDFSRQIAEEFVRNSPTFQFDGIEGSLELVDAETLAQVYQ